MKRRDVERFDLRKESSTTRVVSFANALALAAFISNSSRLSKAKSMEASFYFKALEGRGSLLRRLLPKQKQQLFDSVINLNPL
jgi:hypothetical protein